MTIDELMAQVDKNGGDFEEQELKLDVGLNEFPDVIGDIGDVDVDTNAEAAGKLDLAKIYLEMNDPQGAIKLLEEAIVYGEDDIRREAKGLLTPLTVDKEKWVANAAHFCIWKDLRIYFPPHFRVRRLK